MPWNQAGINPLPAHVALHRRAEEGHPAAVAQMIGLSPDYVWLPVGDGLVQERLAAAGYGIHLQTNQSFVAVRPGAPPLAAATAPLRPCFP